ncbi:MAG: hypothetical protein WC833_02565 [Bacteroidales bacterium]|jgi:hypothetical protein
MKDFDIKKYLIRVVKYAISLTIIFFILIAIMAITSKQGLHYENFFRPGTGGQMLVFLVVISFVYPLFGYVKKKVYLNRSFTEDKEKIKEIIINCRFILVSEDATTITFRPSSKFVRAMRMFEDSVVLDFSDNPITLNGLRKDVYRLSRSIEYAVRDQSTE